MDALIIFLLVALIAAAIAMAALTAVKRSWWSTLSFGAVATILCFIAIAISLRISEKAENAEKEVETFVVQWQGEDPPGGNNFLVVRDSQSKKIFTSWTKKPMPKKFFVATGDIKFKPASQETEAPPLPPKPGG